MTTPGIRWSQLQTDAWANASIDQVHAFSVRLLDVVDDGAVAVRVYFSNGFSHEFGSIDELDRLHTVPDSCILRLCLAVRGRFKDDPPLIGRHTEIEVAWARQHACPLRCTGGYVYSPFPTDAVTEQTQRLGDELLTSPMRRHVRRSQDEVVREFQRLNNMSLDVHGAPEEREISAATQALGWVMGTEERSVYMDCYFIELDEPRGGAQRSEDEIDHELQRLDQLHPGVDGAPEHQAIWAAQHALRWVLRDEGGVIGFYYIPHDPGVVPVLWMLPGSPTEPRMLDDPGGIVDPLFRPPEDDHRPPGR